MITTLINVEGIVLESDSVIPVTNSLIPVTCDNNNDNNCSTYINIIYWYSFPLKSKMQHLFCNSEDLIFVSQPLIDWHTITPIVYQIFNRPKPEINFISICLSLVVKTTTNTIPLIANSTEIESASWEDVFRKLNTWRHTHSKQVAMKIKLTQGHRKG